MTMEQLSQTCRDLAPAISNHLWQSTVFLAAAALLTVALRRNHAHTRYWLWLAASIKFLLPFSLLAVLGSHLAVQHRSAAAQDSVYSAFEEVDEPFSVPSAPMVTAAPADASPRHLLPVVLAAVWLAGFASVLMLWGVYWRRLRVAMRAAVRLDEGREVEMLRRVEGIAGVPAPIDVLVMASNFGPGVYGIFRSTLLWPRGISERLDDGHIEAIFAHELCHVRRQDNLTAVLHMLVEAVFWFHPLVWWVGARLEAERERACDEAALLICDQPNTYAESILKVCEFYVESPLQCVSGVTGADLKRRLADILERHTTLKLTLSKKLLLFAAGLTAAAVPVLFGQVERVPHPTAGLGDAEQKSATQDAVTRLPVNSVSVPIKFDVVSIRRNPAMMGPTTARFEFRPDGDGLVLTDILLSSIVGSFYGFNQDSQTGMPGWANSECYDIQAKVADSDLAVYHTLTKEQRNRMVQAVLEERFKLQVHLEEKEAPIYALVVAKSGSKLKEAKSDEVYISGPKGADGQFVRGTLFVSGDGEETAHAAAMSMFAKSLTQFAGRKVVDKTGLTGVYDFQFKWKSNNNDAEGPSVFTALEEQLGLKLEPAKGMVQTLVIDRIERPTPQDQTQSSEGGPSSPQAVKPLEFDVASVRENKSGTPANGGDPMKSTVPLNPSDDFVSTGGTLRATNFPLVAYIYFAYKVNNSQYAGLTKSLPEWVMTDRFDIQAKTDKHDATKDEMRLMMRSLLAERFALAVHSETREEPVYALVLVKPGKLGPRLRPYLASEAPCTNELKSMSAMPQLRERPVLLRSVLFHGEPIPEEPPVVADGYPAKCGGITSVPSPTLEGRMIPGARNVTIPLIANYLTLPGRLDHPVIDETGLLGKFDFTLDFARFPGPGADPDPNDPRPVFRDALMQQLGMRLELEKGSMDVWVVDHVEHPSAN